MRPSTVTTLAAPPRRVPAPLPRTAGIPRETTTVNRNLHSNSNNITSSPTGFLNQLRSTASNKGSSSSSKRNNKCSEDLSTLPRTTLGRPGPLGAPPSSEAAAASVRVNPFQFHQFTARPQPQPQPQQQQQQQLYQHQPHRSVDNYRAGQSPMLQSPVSGLSPQLARLTRTLKRNSDNNTDSAYSTATLATDYQNVMTVSDDNVYCEISSPAAAAAGAGGCNYPVPANVGGAQHHHNHYPRRPRWPRVHNEDDDTATDVHNLSDFSDDDYGDDDAGEELVQMTTGESDSSNNSRRNNKSRQRSKNWIGSPSSSDSRRRQTSATSTPLRARSRQQQQQQFDFVNGKVSAII